MKLTNAAQQTHSPNILHSLDEEGRSRLQKLSILFAGLVIVLSIYMNGGKLLNLAAEGKDLFSILYKASKVTAVAVPVPSTSNIMYAS